MSENQNKSSLPQVPTKINTTLGVVLIVCMLIIGSLNIAAAFVGLDRDSKSVSQDLSLVKK